MEFSSSGEAPSWLEERARQQEEQALAKLREFESGSAVDQLRMLVDPGFAVLERLPGIRAREASRSGQDSEAENT